MSLMMLNQILQFAAWLIALIELIIGLYVLMLNIKHSANRHGGAILILLAVNTFAVGWMLSVTNWRDAYTPGAILAATTPIIQPALLIAILAILKPEWLRGKGRWIWWLVYLYTLAPIAATIYDSVTGSHYWFLGFSTEYAGGFNSIRDFTGGLLSEYFQIASSTVIPALAIIILLYLSFLDKRISSNSRRLALLLLTAEVIAAALLVFVAPMLVPAVAAIVSSTLLAIVYGYAAFQQMASEQRAQAGSIRLRLTALTLVVSIPLLVAVSVFVTRQAGLSLAEEAQQNLVYSGRALSTTLSQWQEANVRALQNLVSQPDIQSMDPSLQKPVLEAMAATYPHMYLVSTTDMNGINVARSDDEALTDYSDRVWFTQVRDGATVASQTLVGRTTGQPALVIALPIRSDAGEVAGVAMFATDLDTVAAQVQAERSDEGGLAFVVDVDNKVIAHLDPAYTAELRDLSTYPPVAARRADQSTSQSSAAPVTFTDASGVTWRASASRLDNGWIVVVQRPETDLLGSTRVFQQVAFISIAIGAFLLLLLSLLTIRQALQPIGELTETARSIASGDLTRVATIQSEDELGFLARAFNSMTTQLRESITNLERRVAERTRDLERRAVQLEVAAEVSSEAAAIRELRGLLDHTVRLISERFYFYHAGIFLVDESQKFAVLRAASSEGGQRMLARGHRLAIGQVGIVGYVAGKGETRIVHDVGTDAVFFNNPDLPQTRSEMALPLVVRDRVIGVLDVQSTKAAAFSDDDAEILQILAHQIALAIHNASLLEDSQEVIRELDSLYRRQVSESWQKRLEGTDIIYSFSQGNVQKEAEFVLVEPENGRNGHTIQLPLVLRGQPLGNIVLRREEHAPPWTKDDLALVKDTLSQLMLAIENARLLEENRRRAQNEKLVGDITAKTQGLLDVDAVIKTAVKEIGRSLGLRQVQIRLQSGQDDNDQVTEPIGAKSLDQ